MRVLPEVRLPSKPAPAMPIGRGASVLPVGRAIAIANSLWPGLGGRLDAVQRKRRGETPLFLRVENSSPGTMSAGADSALSFTARHHAALPFPPAGRSSS